MALKNDAVSMPEERITFKKAPNGTEYVYYTLRAYRNKHGKPTSDEVAIGKKDKETGKLIPNKRYYEIYHVVGPSEAAKITPCKAQSYGNVVTLMEMARATGLLQILEQCFPDKWERILAVAFYIVCEGNIMMYIEDWFDETQINFTERMDDVDCSSLFSSISEEEKGNFFKKWVKHREEREYIVYDVSSISSYSRNIDIVEWGYNRDHDKLPQMNLGMYYGITSHMPVYYNLYSGSIPDKTYLDFMMTMAKEIGIFEVCFVMDRGFVMEDNLICITENKFSFITAMPGHLVNTMKLIDENKWNVRKSANRISEFEVYGIQRSVEMYGIDLQAHIYYDPEKQAFDEKELYAHIEKLQAELNKISKSKRVTRKYKSYFSIDEKAPDSITYELDTNKIDEKLERSGFFVLISNNPNLTSGEVLKVYRDRDVIEKNFEEFKNRLDFRRMRTHWNKTTEGKMFVGFMALILRTYMRRMMQNTSQTKNLTFEKILIELKKIRSVMLADMSVVLIPLTKLQKTILTALGVSIEALAD